MNDNVTKTQVEEKRTLRKEAMARRNALSELTRAHKSEKICKQLIQLCEKELRTPAPTIAVYSAMSSEVSLHAFIQKAYAKNWKLAFPCMVKTKQEESAHNAQHSISAKATMKFFDVPEKHLQTCEFVRNPLAKLNNKDLAQAGLHVVSPCELDAIIVPLVAFDAQHTRLGYGGGNYDKYLATLNNNTLICGVAFAEQQVSFVPHEPHDVPLRHIITA